MRTSTKNFFISLLLAGSVFGCFYPVVHHEFLNFDDPSYVVKNPHVFTGLSAANLRWAWTSSYFSIWHPLTWISYMLEVEIHGLDPRVFHLTNLLLHVANTVLLFLWLSRVTNSPWLSAFAAGLFALHPLRVEPVAWVSSRKDVLSTLLLILVLTAYSAYVQRPKWHRYFAVLVLFALGLAAKSMLVTLPVLLLLLDFWPFRRVERASWRRIVWEKVPLLAVSLTVSVATYTIMRDAGGVTSQEKTTSLHYLTNTGLGYCEYLAKTFWPVGLAPFYPRTTSQTELAVGLAAVAVVVAVSAVALFLARRLPALIVGWLWFLVSLVPVIGVVQFGSHRVADRYAYVPSIGLCILLSWCGAEIVTRIRVPKTVVGACAVALLGVLGVASWFQVHKWRDSVTLFEHTLEVTRGNFLAHTNLGSAKLDQGNLQGAMDHFAEALRMNPQYPEAHIGMGNVYVARGDAQQAAAHYMRALEFRPRDIELQMALAECLEQSDKSHEAMEVLEQAVARAPDEPEPRYRLGAALARQGKHAPALEHLRVAVRARPEFVEAHCELANSLLATGRWEEATGHLRHALQWRPDHPETHGLLGLALTIGGRRQVAIEHFVAALQAKPDWAEMHNNLGVALTGLERHEDAVQAFRRAIELKPDVQFGFFNLGCALYACGRRAEAIAAYREGIERDPVSPQLATSLAWALATDEDDGLRNGTEAVRLALEACEATQYGDPAVLDVLAAAYAEAGQFEEAVTTERRALELAQATRQTQPTQAYEKRLDLYKSGRPFRSSSRPVVP
jgi:tetratricopeptide (TPR) repeat protein